MGNRNKHDHGHSHSHGPLGHHHHHHPHDNAYLTSKNKADPGVRITRIGLYSNLGMAIAKGVGGYMFHSHAMIADAWHSVTDLASDVLTLATVSWSSKDPTHKFPTGYGKIESLGSLGVSGMLLVGGILMGWSSIMALMTQLGIDPSVLGELAHAGHSHSHGHSHGGAPSMHAMWLAAGTIAIKEWLYHATMKVAVERKSSVLASNAVHHRVDSWTGIVTLVVILLANVMQNATWLDPVGGIFISLLVVKAGAQNTLSAVGELADRAIDDEVKNLVWKQVDKALDSIAEGQEVEIRDVSGTKSGQNYLIDLELIVPSNWTVEHVSGVETRVREQIGSFVRGAKRVRVRFVSRDVAAAAPEFDEFVSGEVSPEIAESEAEAAEAGEHGHTHDGHDHSHTNGHSHEDHKAASASEEKSARNGGVRRRQ
ncbi:related to mitochondrial iron transporter [Cephalotrichum gorgonifer]|uniref:Related to mitochondrial iron transporter n=1 Tax=Cephalotrichum gorgonifer TaxID=2041049 RepID=A0AAE8SVH9_9PEZI|nr:related to mitochondrial iron transporter [Cephalotrichum gorgonifer]